MAITQTSDFIGEYKINKSCFDDLELFIEKYESYYLVRLLGADLKAAFDADLTLITPQIPQNPPYTDIFEPFAIDDGDCLYLSDGIKQMLVQFIYYHYITEQGYKNTATGMVMANAENSVKAKGFNDIKAYNEAISNYQVIQWYIDDNENTEPLLEIANGIHLDFSNGI